MIILGLAGQARSGKDTVADYLVENYGFIKFAFSDALYREVEIAFGLEEQSLLRDAETKELPTPLLTGENCDDAGFVNLLKGCIDSGDMPLSPRWVLQQWGTEYRRAQEKDYWLRKTVEWITRFQALHVYPEQRPQYFVNTTVRFPNERTWIHSAGGNVWHIRRDGITSVNAHVSETELDVLEFERELFNNDTVQRLHAGIDLMLSSSAKFVRVEPLLPNGQYYSLQPDGHNMLCNADGTRSIFDDVDE